MKFEFEKMRNAVSQDVEIKPEGLDSVTFTLRPLNTQTSFAVQSFLNEPEMTTAMRIQYEIGVGRVIGWKNVLDEEGNEVEFNPKNFATFNNMPDAIPYLMAVGHLTIDEVIKDREKKMGKKESKQAKKPKTEEVSPSASTPS